MTPSGKPSWQPPAHGIRSLRLSPRTASSATKTKSAHGARRGSDEYAQEGFFNHSLAIFSVFFLKLSLLWGLFLWIVSNFSHFWWRPLQKKCCWKCLTREKWFFPPHYYTITKNIWWKRFRANLECGLFSTKMREEKLQPQPWDW